VADTRKCRLRFTNADAAAYRLNAALMPPLVALDAGDEAGFALVGAVLKDRNSQRRLV